MKTKSWIYFSILVAWLVTCILLFCLKLIDFVGIIVSFIFAIPTMIYDFVVTFKATKRQKQLKALNKIYKLEDFIKNVIVETGKTNNARIRAGMITKMGEEDPSKIINDQLNQSKKFYIEHFSNLFGKKEAENKFFQIKNNRNQFFIELQSKILKINPSEEELRAFDIKIDNETRRKLFINQNKEKINEIKI